LGLASSGYVLSARWLLRAKAMKIDKIIDTFIWGGIPIAEKLPTRPLRFIGILIAFLCMIISSIIWIPLVIISGFQDIFNNLKERKY
jgi:hypothetical protein